MIRVPTLLSSLCFCVLLSGCCKKKEDSGQKGSVAAASASAVPKETPSGDVTLQRKPFQVGAKRVVEESGELNLQLKMGPRDSTISEKESNRRTEEILAVDGDKITKLKVTYEAYSKESSKEDRARKAPDLLSGKTFLIEV
ncbi:MAG: hypothetical protein RMJ98_19745, partial [Myxococcales bacterium]|nr:hypothetical protein [Polyangiaceae bacterium]MDW8251534.1 hypothetical protein [Myxococcales bacterium]